MALLAGESRWEALLGNISSSKSICSSVPKLMSWSADAASSTNVYGESVLESPSLDKGDAWFRALVSLFDAVVGDNKSLKSFDAKGSKVGATP